jgi:anthranilate synthase component 1
LNKSAAVLRRTPERIGYSFVHALDDNLNLHALHCVAPERYPFLLQSTASDSSLGRFDILFACPGDSIVLENIGKLAGKNTGTEFLTALDDSWQQEKTGRVASPLPFLGGWFVYLGYELAAEIEPALTLATDPVLPAAFAVRCSAAIIRDTESGECHLVIENDAQFDDAQVWADIATCQGDHEATSAQPPYQADFCEEPADVFTSAVRQAKKHISAGDIYQANLSRKWSAKLVAGLSADQIYTSLGRSNPAPFSGLARWNGASIISSSPERLLKIRDGSISTRPIAGTRPRSSDQNLDKDLSAELFAHPKELAEHVMLIDLERNDIGRVCRPGTVEVDEMMVLESYAHVHHIVSNVRGRIRDDVTPGDAIRAVFPGGTITGCPKVRCMEIISELENGPRGAYTGSFGYLNRDGSMDLNILIRTIVLHGDEISFRAGSGIVADSEPDAELEETRAKAKGMLRAMTA